ncbi:phosphoglycerate mutase-like protein [Mycena floridula]|nr:phosphoglycerate mutase-like protein [Mycena floridula]
MSAIRRVYFVRHGETAANRAGIIQGHLDTELNDEGREQAQLVAAALKNVQFDIAYTSDLQRAVDVSNGFLRLLLTELLPFQTAKAIMEYHPGVQLILQEELRERHMGSMQGQEYFNSQSHRETWLKSDTTGESSGAFVARGLDWWDRHILGANMDLSSSTVLVTSHGGYISVLMKNLIQNKKIQCAQEILNWKCDNCSITILEVDGGSGMGTLIQYSDNEHLKRENIVDNVDQALERDAEMWKKW